MNKVTFTNVVFMSKNGFGDMFRKIDQFKFKKKSLKIISSPDNTKNKTKSHFPCRIKLNIT